MFARIWSPGEGVQSGVVGHALRGFSRQWAMSYLGSLGPDWHPVKQQNMEPKTFSFNRTIFLTVVTMLYVISPCSNINL